MDNQISIFSMNYEEPLENNLHVVKCKYLDSYDTNKNELFKGFDDIKVLTFSYGISFINFILDNFETAEIVIGSETHAKYDIKEVMANQQDPGSPFFAFQGATIRRIRRHEKLVNRIKKGEVSIWLAKDITSHEKLYILSAKNGNTRVITGSANFSASAFSGDAQREGIYVFDNDIGAYNEALEEYEMVRDFCTQKIIKESIYYSSDGSPTNEEKEIKELPIIREAIAKEAGIILNMPADSDDDIEYAIDVNKFINKFAKLVPKKKADATVLKITPQKVHELIRNYNKGIREEKEKRKEAPQFTVDIELNKAFFNEKEIDLTSDNELIKQDLEKLFQFFEGYDNFFGDSDVTRENTFMLMNYIFMTPFIGYMRKVALKHNYLAEYYPIFAVLSGPKSSGKSTFVKAMQKFMFQKDIPGFSSDDWVKTTAQKLLSNISGIPLLFDDIGRNRFNQNAESIIKEDEYINLLDNTSVPSFIITSNDIETSVDTALKKRMIYITLNLTLNDVTAAHMKKGVLDGISNISGAFYREYIKRIIPKIKETLSLMESDYPESSKWHPDLLKISSEVIIDIVKNYATIQPYILSLSFEDYFGDDTIIRKEIKEKILTDYEHNKKAFNINRKKNELVYTAGERAYEARRIYDALPEFLEAKVVSNMILMPLDKAELFFGIKFKKGLFG